jgi:hypothetical protein
MAPAKLLKRLQQTQKTVNEDPDRLDQCREGGRNVVLEYLAYDRIGRWPDDACSLLVSRGAVLALYVPKG